MNNSRSQSGENTLRNDKQIDDLLAKMTLEEKAGQMNQVGSSKSDITDLIKTGRIGSILSIKDVKKINHFQQIAVQQSRLGIPLLIGNDVIHGYQTLFPIPLAQACSWNLELVEKAARIAATEALREGTSWIYAPMIDIARDPRWGRVAEGAGEDVFLAGQIARANVRGTQRAEDAGKHKVAACPKHFVAYGAAEAGKDYNTVDISERTLRDIYLPPFQAAFAEGAYSVMVSFNEIAGIPSTANRFLLRTILRDELGFTGVAISDYYAIGELLAHGLASDMREAALKSIQAGIDIDMVSDAYIDYLPELVRSGAVDEKLVDEAVRRILVLKQKLGLFENFHMEPAAEISTDTKEYRETALQLACESIVLLKNEGALLPLRPDQKKVALIGPLGKDKASLLGCWKCSGSADRVESLYEGLSAVMTSEPEFVEGCHVLNKESASFKQAIAIAKKAEVIILAIGETDAMSGEAHSRAHLGLPGRQQELVEAIHALGKPVIAVLMSGRPLVTPWIAEHIPAIIQAWHGGDRAGRAIAEILCGRANPSGKLVLSIPRSEGQIPVYYAHKNTGRPATGKGTTQFEEPFRSNYLDIPNSPQFPFGHGLSYTTFAYNDLEIKTPSLTAVENLIVTVHLSNTGARPGIETAQLYVQDLVGNITRPVKELKAFQRVALSPGEQKTIRFEVPASTLGFHDIQMRYQTEPGDFKVWVGPNSAEGLEEKFTIMAKRAAFQI